MIPGRSKSDIRTRGESAPRVLVVEPSTIARMTIVRVCEELGLTALEEDSVSAALERSATSPPDAAIVAKQTADYPGESLQAAWSRSPEHREIPVAIVAQGRVGIAGLHTLVRGEDLAHEAEHFLRRHVLESRPTPLDSLEGITVLIVDDMPAMRRLMTHLLTRAGADVRTAEHGLDALAFFGIPEDGTASPDDEHPPIDLVVTDLEMPYLDGLGLFKRLRERGVDVPILACSAHDPEHLPHLSCFDAVVEKDKAPRTMVDVCLQLLSGWSVAA